MASIAFENGLKNNTEELEKVREQCKEIINYIHGRIDPSIEYYMEKMVKKNEYYLNYFS
jgi:hypothetical protein